MVMSEGVFRDIASVFATLVNDSALRGQIVGMSAGQEAENILLSLKRADLNGDAMDILLGPECPEDRFYDRAIVQRYVADIPFEPYGDDMLKALASGDVRASSFITDMCAEGFVPTEDYLTFFGNLKAACEKNEYRSIMLYTLIVLNRIGVPFSDYWRYFKNLDELEPGIGAPNDFNTVLGLRSQLEYEESDDEIWNPVYEELERLAASGDRCAILALLEVAKYVYADGNLFDREVDKIREWGLTYDDACTRDDLGILGYRIYTGSYTTNPNASRTSGIRMLFAWIIHNDFSDFSVINTLHMFDMNKICEDMATMTAPGGCFGESPALVANVFGRDFPGREELKHTVIPVNEMIVSLYARALRKVTPETALFYAYLMSVKSPRKTAKYIEIARKFGTCRDVDRVEAFIKAQQQ